MLEFYTKTMLKKVTFLNIVLGLSLTVLTYMFFKEYALILFLGVMIASLNYVLNGIIIAKVLSRKGHKLVILVSFLFRVLLVSFIGLLVYKENKFNVIAYMLGYSILFISLILYGVSVKNE